MKPTGYLTNGGMYMPEIHELQAMQKLPLYIKIKKTILRIQEWYDYWGGDVYVSFSGGKDSTVLLDICRKLYPNIRAAFLNTGLEYPEIVEFVKTFDNVDIIRPKMTFPDVITKYGYPVITKEQAHFIYQARHTKSEHIINKVVHGIAKNGTPTRFRIQKKWLPLLDAPFEISDLCCDVMKKRPIKKFEKETGLHPITGTMAEESTLRRTTWVKTGCNSFTGTRPLSAPMSFWTEQDVLMYIYENRLPIADVYGDVLYDETEEKFFTTGVNRTGCMFCMFGVHLDASPNRFEQMKETHPKQYAYCMRGGCTRSEDNMWVPSGGLGMAKVLDYLNIKY